MYIYIYTYTYDLKLEYGTTKANTLDFGKIIQIHDLK